MAHPLDRARIDQQERESAKLVKAQEDQFRKDVQEVMNLPAMRRVLWRFMQEMGIDGSSFSPNAMTQSHGIGKQDAAKWWIAVIRDHCPEKEAQIRKEAINAAKRLQLEEDSNDD